MFITPIPMETYNAIFKTPRLNFSRELENFTQCSDNHEKQVVKVIYFLKMLHWTSRKKFCHPSGKKFAGRPRYSRPMSKNDGTKNMFSQKNVSVVINTKNEVFKTPPLEFSKELKSLIQCMEMKKNKFLRIYFFLKK